MFFPLWGFHWVYYWSAVKIRDPKLECRVGELLEPSCTVMHDVNIFLGQGESGWLVVGPPLWKIWTSIGMISNPIYGKIKNVPNHQPAGNSDGLRRMSHLPVLGRYVAGQPSMLMIHTYPEKKWDVKPQKPEPQWSTILPNLRFDMISNVNESLTEALPRKTHGFVFYLLIGGPSGYSIWLGNGIPIYSLLFCRVKGTEPQLFATVSCWTFPK